MKTAGHVVRKALEAILVQAPQAPLEPEDVADGITAMNEYLLALDTDGLRLGYVPVASVSDLVNVPDGAVRGLIANLAIELAPSYGATASPELLKRARDGYATMARLGLQIMDTSYPATLPLGGGNRGNTHDDMAYRESQLRGRIMLNNNTLQTMIQALDERVLVEGDWAVVDVFGMQSTVAGRLISKADYDVQIDVSASLEAEGDGEYTFAMNRSGVAVVSQTVTLTPGTRVPVSLRETTVLRPSDTLYLSVESATTTAPVVVPFAQIEVSS